MICGTVCSTKLGRSNGEGAAAPIGSGNVAEGENAMLKGGFVDIQQKFFRAFRLTKLTFLPALTIAGYNIECIRSFKARQADEAETPRRKSSVARGASRHAVASRQRADGYRARPAAWLIRAVRTTQCLIKDVIGACR